MTYKGYLVTYDHSYRFPTAFPAPISTRFAKGTWFHAPAAPAPFLVRRPRWPRSSSVWKSFFMARLVDLLWWMVSKINKHKCSTYPKYVCIKDAEVSELMMFKDKQVFVWMRMTETVVIVIASMMKTKMTTMITIMNSDHGSRPLTKSKCIHSSGPTTANSKQMNTNNEQETPTATNNNSLEGEAKEATKRRKSTNRKKQHSTIQQTLHHNFAPKTCIQETLTYPISALSISLAGF